MADAQFVNLETVDGILIACLTCPKVLERESEIVGRDVQDAASDGPWRVVLDMAEVTMLGSVGIGMLVTLHTSAQREGGKFVVCGLNADLYGLMKMTRLHKLLKIVGTREQAIEAVS